MKIILYVFSIILMAIGLSFIIIYTNLFAFGYSFFNYCEFIFTRFEVIVFFIGFIFLFITKKYL